MVGAKIGPLFGIFGSILVIGFNLIIFGVGLPLIISGIEVILIIIVFALAIGLAGILGGILAFRGKEFGNYIPLAAVVIAGIGMYIPVGEVVHFMLNTSLLVNSFIAKSSFNLFTSFFYIDFFFMSLATVLSLLNKITVRNATKKTLEVATKIEEKNKVRKILMEYIYENKGNAFTAESLHKKCIENTRFDFSIADTEIILYDLHTLGKIRLDIKETVNYYF